MSHTSFYYNIDLGPRAMSVFVEYHYTIEIDPDYGADADGNRGVKMAFITDEKITVWDKLGNNITAKIEKKYPKEFQKLFTEGSENL